MLFYGDWSRLVNAISIAYLQQSFALAMETCSVEQPVLTTGSWGSRTTTKKSSTMNSKAKANFYAWNFCRSKPAVCRRYFEISVVRSQRFVSLWGDIFIFLVGVALQALLSDVRSSYHLKGFFSGKERKTGGNSYKQGKQTQTTRNIYFGNRTQATAMTGERFSPPPAPSPSPPSLHHGDHFRTSTKLFAWSVLPQHKSSPVLRWVAASQSSPWWQVRASDWLWPSASWILHNLEVFQLLRPLKTLQR